MSLRFSYVVLAIAALGVSTLFFFHPASGPDPIAFRTLSYVDQLSDIRAMAKIDPLNAWKFLLSAGLVNGQAVVEGHSMGHIIGNEIYRQLGLSGIKVCTNDFAYACMHGVTEKLFADKGPSAIPEVEATCEQYFSNGSNPDKLSGCIHGAGHGLLSYFAYDVPRALEACGGFDARLRTYCYDGTFMEASQGSPQTVAMLAKDPWLVCASVPESALFACSKYVPVALQADVPMESLNNTASQFEGFVAVCAKAPRADERRWCIDTVGHMLAQQSHGDLGDIVTKCSVALEYRDACIAAAATELGFQGYEGWRDSIPQLCANIADATNKETCVNGGLSAAAHEGKK